MQNARDKTGADHIECELLRTAANNQSEMTQWVINRRDMLPAAWQKYPRKPPRLRVTDQQFEA
jgi:hypothetical protein